MTVHKIRLGTNEDGTPLWHYHQDDPTKALLVTGPITGTVEVDGETFDVTEAVIEVESEAVALLVSDAIGTRHVEEGHPAFADEAHDFTHTPSTEV